MRALARSWPLLVCLLGLNLALLAVLGLSLEANQGRLIYSLDDAYIHMAVARNLAQHGVWGITRHAFTSSSSSLLWTAILAACDAVLGVHDETPLVLNWLAGCLLLVLVYRLLRSSTSIPLYHLCGLAAAALLYPLVPLIFSGQEHVTHALLTVLFVAAAVDLLVTVRPPGRTILVRLGLLTLGFAAIRYESLFVVCSVCLLLIVRKRLLAALTVASAALVPIAAWAAVSLSRGWFAVPNTVLVKGRMPDLSSPWTAVTGFALTIVRVLLLNRHILLMVLAALLLVAIEGRRRRSLFTRPSLYALVFIGAVLPHLGLARTLTYQFMRYEAYLLALPLLAWLLAVPSWLQANTGLSWRRKLASAAAPVAACVVLAVTPLTGQTVAAHRKTVAATVNIHQQQYQMGLFVGQYYSGRGVALNDIGAVNYLADIHCLDLWGLSDMVTAGARLRGELDSHLIDRLARDRGIAIAIVYETWLQPLGGPPPDWLKVAEWKIPNNQICGNDTVSFFAVDPDQRQTLADNLGDYRRQLPEAVTFRWFAPEHGGAHLHHQMP